TTTRQLLRSFPHKGICLDARFSKDGQFLATASLDQVVRVWDLATGTERASRAFPARVFSARFSPDEQRLVVGCRAKAAYLWNWQAGSSEEPLMLEHPEEVLDAAYATNGHCVITVCGDDVVRFWDARTGRLAAPPMVGPASKSDPPVPS